jgi:DNA polymerase III subunit delta'
MPSSEKSSTVLFDAVRGHGPQKERLRAALEAGRLPHALLLAGPSGVGKRRVAWALAQALLCEAPSGRPCGICSGCLKVAGDIHPSVLRIAPDPESKSKEIALKQITDLGAVVSRTPGEGGRYVVLLDDADAMNLFAQNAFLKTLEEPAAPVHFILVTSDPNRLLPTIRSRCQVVRFGALGANDTEDILMAEDGFSPYEASEYARLSQGSVEEALLLKDGGYREIVDEAFALVRLSRERRVVEWPRVSTSRDELLLLTDALIRIYRDFLVLAATPSIPSNRLFFSTRADDLASLARGFDPEQAGATLEALVETRDRLLAYVNPRLVSAQLLLDLGLKLF